jgi:hypothetical protein
MKVSKRHLIKAILALDWIRKQMKDTETSFKTSRQLRVYDPAYKELDTSQAEIRREHTLIDEDTGQPVTSLTESGQVGTRLTDQFAYEDAMEELLSETLEISVTPMKKDPFKKTFKKIEGGHLMALVDIGFVEDPDMAKTETEDAEDDEEDADE